MIARSHRLGTLAIRTLKFALRYDPANSRAIGHYATQQNTAYNVDGDVLNREPSWLKRSDRNHSDALNKRVTAWRETDRQKADAPYHIHQEGGEQVWEAKQRLREARAERLERIAHAIAGGEEPKKRDTRPHRRTVAHRTRKHSRLSLTITDRRLFQVSDGGQTLPSRQCGFTVRLRGHQTPKWLDIRSIHLVPVKSYGPRTPLQRRRYCLHVQVGVLDRCSSKHWTSKAQRTSSAPTGAPRTTYPSVPAAEPTIRAAVDAAIKSESISATSRASPVTAGADGAPSRSPMNEAAVTPEPATKIFGARSELSSSKHSPRWSPAKACIPSA